jgi:hypothetical protein
MSFILFIFGFSLNMVFLLFHFTDINLKILTGQILLLKIGEIKNLLHFFAKIDGYNIYWPCSYVDAKKIKEVEPGINFKDNYHHKTCVAKIEEVTDTNMYIKQIEVAENRTVN